MLKTISLIFILLTLNACAALPVKQPQLSDNNGNNNAEIADTYVSLGLTHLEIGNFTEAKVNFDKALELEPKSGRANYAMAFYYQQVDVAQLTAQYYKNAVNLAGNDELILSSYGEFLCEQGNYDEAKPYFLEVVDYKDPISTAITYEHLAVCAQKQGNINEAILHYHTALKYDPNKASNLLALSALYVKTNKWDKAQEIISQYELTKDLSEESLWLSMQIARGQNDYYSAVEYTQLLTKRYPLHVNTRSAIDLLAQMQGTLPASQKSLLNVNELAPTANGIATYNAANNVTNNNVELSSVLKRPLTTASASLSYEELVGAPEKTQGPQMKIKAKNVADIIDNQTLITSPKKTVVKQPAAFHIVKPKENLYRISLMHNLQINKLREWNKIDEGTTLKIGAKLWLIDPSLSALN